MDTTPKSLDHLRALALERGGECLSKTYFSMNAPYSWRCKVGHRWESKAYSVAAGHWCPLCAGVKKDTKKILRRAKNIGWTLLDPSLRGSSYKHRWLCAKGHVSVVRWANIGVCKHCYRENFWTLDDAHKLAQERGGRCLAQILVNSKTPTRWECVHLHKWEAALSDVVRGTWCPSCPNTSSKGELAIYEAVKAIYPDAQNGVRGLLKNKKFELDIWIPSKRKAIEYDGQYWHSTLRTKDRDRRKNLEAKRAGIQLLRIKEEQWEKSPIEVLSTIKDFLLSKNLTSTYPW
jgi:hypothetical protein